MTNFKMMKFKTSSALLISACLVIGLNAIPMTASAKSAKRKASKKISKLDIRSVETSSVDLFEVLSHMPKADAAFKSGDYSAALQHYRYVYLHDPAQSRAAMGYADAALALGQVALADEVYKTADITNLRAQSGRLLTGILSGNIDKPEDQLRAQLNITSDDARLWNMLGHVLDKDNRGDEARQAYAMAQLSGQRAGLAANNIGQSLLKDNRLEDALVEFTRASLDAPQNRLFDNNRRLTLLLQKNYAEALAQLDKDRAAQLLKDAGLIVARQGERKLAVFFLEKSIAINPVYDAQAAQYLKQLSQ